MSEIPGTAVVQVTNLSSAVSREQMRTLFGFLGDIEELRLYPPDNTTPAFSSKVCYIKYRDSSSVGVAQHLTNTVFIDRALIVVPCAEGKIPEESKALSLLAPVTAAPTLIPGGGLLPIPTAGPLQNLSPSLMNRLPASLDLTSVTSTQPPIMGNVDPSKIDEIRRTVYVGNLNSQTTTADQLLEFFRQVGEVKFVRMAGDETQPTRFAFVEFVDQNAVARALTFNGVMFGDRPLKVNHSNNAIVKPPELTPQAAAKELESVMKRVREAQSTIAAAIEPVDKSKSYSSRSRRSHRSRSRSRSHSLSKSGRKRSHLNHQSSQKSRFKGHGHSSMNIQRRHSHSRDGRHSRSRSRGYRRRSKSRTPPQRARSKTQKRGKMEHQQEHSRGQQENTTYRKRNRQDDIKTQTRIKVVRDHRQVRKHLDSDREDSAGEDVTSPCAQHNGS